MTTPTKTVVNVQTGETTIVELSGAELEAYEASLAQQAAEQAAAEAAQQAPAETPTEGQ
jgi:hypothetical protein